MIAGRLTYANVVSSLALFIVLGGTSYAVATGSIGSREIKNNAVRSKDLRNNDVRSSDVKNGSLLGKDFKAGQLPAGPQGPQGPAGTPNGYTRSEADARFVDAAGAQLTMTTPRQSGWLRVDPALNSPSEEFLSDNGGLTIYPTGGTLPRSIFAVGSLPVPALIGGQAARATALHLCYRARPTAKLNSVTLAKYKFDVLEGADLPAEEAVLHDATERTVGECRRFPLPPGTISRPADLFEVKLEVIFSGQGQLNRFRVFSAGIEVSG